MTETRIKIKLKTRVRVEMIHSLSKVDCTVLEGDKDILQDCCSIDFLISPTNYKGIEGLAVGDIVEFDDFVAYTLLPTGARIVKE
jgi:hypothetical protein